MTYTLKQTGQYEQWIKKSRFVATAMVIQTEAEALAAFQQWSVPSASHNCWAWRLGGRARFNDDGEPSGTAGRPLLALLESRQLDGVWLLVTRWYGGIKLGVGGLVRAYSGTAAACLDGCGSMEQQTLIHYRLKVDFAAASSVHHQLDAHEAEKLGETYLDDGLQLDISIDERRSQALTRALNNALSGRISIRRLL